MHIVRKHRKEVINLLTLSEKIAALRHRHNMSHEDMCKLLGISRPTYSGREKGLTSWRLDELEKIAKTFGVTVKDLIDDPSTMQ
jgi:transcriptional regulator with XRE-family HTH domain